ncbi:DUF2567 domain-containing protein [Streptomyces sp. TRM66268-LWL]|uniref:DUF2567 domain-containing protein n=1 Tax=Streptomyces polyasparticus TaxID=2767826 RepID=A0ABR7SCW2_9ACTN|nr:DUF2567 domain-containing protein [Streptomyces polyasparticus]MBC9712178.1 DUF2567 domain-containing protein [Streptomyces polyasparticus]
MTAPLTPPQKPHTNQPSDPWQAPPQVPAESYAAGGPGLTAEVRDAVLIVIGLAVTGVVLGVLWAWLSPHVPLVSDGKAVFLGDTEGEQAIGSDGTFILLALACGAVTGALVFLLRRHGGIPLVIALAVGGLLASVVAWQLGLVFGPGDDVVARAKEAGEGVAFDAPLELNAKGALLAWPIAALAVHLALTALFGPRDPEPPQPAGWDAPQPKDGYGTPQSPSKDGYGTPQSPS